ncbi:thioesterase II family protein [Actinoallomurus soli]|uniref:thioesterase II family protein n=1 Tax=Actinoallomurus soli TaxID=2952535 RepID=UPI002093C17B|nr:alpha/beta fold hydrolase [Actinoallomurus soli]MCO5973406.1 alpha/beta fold hydrolase [Actinoallomurus soli]
MPGWIRTFQARPAAATRLICFPHAGGSAAFYRPWALAATEVDVRIAEYPGRADRLFEPLVDDAVEVARAVTEALLPLLDRPVALFGHSMGATIAYETARLLAARGTPPAHLFVSASRAPGDRPVKPAGEVFHDKDDDVLVAELVRLGGTDAQALADPQLRELVLPYIRSDFRLLESYRHAPGPPLDVPITAFTADADPIVTPAQAERWAEVTTGAFALRIYPGDHFYLLPHRDALLAAIQEGLAGRVR